MTIKNRIETNPKVMMVLKNTINQLINDDIDTHELTNLISESGGFNWLGAEEDIYSMEDGEEVAWENLMKKGAGHASASEALVGRIITALISQGLLNESVGAGYLERNWPPALKESGAWPLVSLRQSFLNGALTRLLDPDAVLKGKIVEFVSKGDFGLASGQRADGTYERVWFQELISTDEVAFESGVFLLIKAKAKDLKGIGRPEPGTGTTTTPITKPKPEEVVEPGREKEEEKEPSSLKNTLRLNGTIPPEIWNRLGTKVIPKLKSAGNLQVKVDFSVNLDTNLAKSLQSDLTQVLEELGLSGKLNIDLFEE